MAKKGPVSRILLTDFSWSNFPFDNLQDYELLEHFIQGPFTSFVKREIETYASQQKPRASSSYTSGSPSFGGQQLAKCLCVSTDLSLEHTRLEGLVPLASFTSLRQADLALIRFSDFLRVCCLVSVHPDFAIGLPVEQGKLLLWPNASRPNVVRRHLAGQLECFFSFVQQACRQINSSYLSYGEGLIVQRSLSSPEDFTLEEALKVLRFFDLRFGQLFSVSGGGSVKNSHKSKAISNYMNTRYPSSASSTSTPVVLPSSTSFHAVRQHVLANIVSAPVFAQGCLEAFFKALRSIKDSSYATWQSIERATSKQIMDILLQGMTNAERVKDEPILLFALFRVSNILGHAPSILLKGTYLESSTRDWQPRRSSEESYLFSAQQFGFFYEYLETLRDFPASSAISLFEILKELYTFRNLDTNKVFEGFSFHQGSQPSSRFTPPVVLEAITNPRYTSKSVLEPSALFNPISTTTPTPIPKKKPLSPPPLAQDPSLPQVSIEKTSCLDLLAAFGAILDNASLSSQTPIDPVFHPDLSACFARLVEEVSVPAPVSPVAKLFTSPYFEQLETVMAPHASSLRALVVGLGDSEKDTTLLLRVVRGLVSAIAQN